MKADRKPATSSTEPAPAAEPSRRPTSALRWFTAMPVAMLLDPALSSDAKVLAGILLHYDGPTGCHPKVDSLMRDMNGSKNKVLRLLEELERYGFLARERRGRNNTYSLRPVYERPIRPASLEATGELQSLNAPRARPEKRNALHKPRPAPTLPLVVEPLKKVPSVERIENARGQRKKRAFTEQVPSVEPVRFPTEPANAKSVPSMEPVLQNVRADSASSAVPAVEPFRAESVPPVEPDCVPSVEPDRPEQFHAWDLDITKNQRFIKKQQHQDDRVGGEKEVSVNEGVAALQRVRVNLTAGDLGTHAGRERELRGQELVNWAIWVVSGSENRISNKAAFAAAKIRMGCTLGDAFPEQEAEMTRVRQREKEKAAFAAAEARVNLQHEHRDRRADELIARMRPDERRRLRQEALNDAAVWIARNASDDVFALILAGAERRLILGESSPPTIARDYASRNIAKFLDPVTS